MKIKIELSVKKGIIAGILMIASILYAISTDLSIKFAVALPVMLFLGFFIRIKLIWKWLDIVAFMASSFVSLTILQLETGSVINDLGIKKMILNWFLALCIFVFILLFCKKISTACKIGSIVLFILGFADALVIAFRGNQISVNDIYSIRTALSVVGNYKLSLNPMFILAIVIFAGYFMCLNKVEFAAEKTGKTRFIGIPVIILLVIITIMNMQSYHVSTWENKGCTTNGVFLEWVLEVRDLQIKEPENYSVEYIENILGEYSERRENTSPPHIVVVMSEAYSDLTVLGDIETSKEVMPNFDELYKESVHGYALSSVFGGNTAVSEWEFLTGSSMAFMPAGSVAYQQYVKNGDNSLVSYFKNEGYYTIAMHPYLPNGWNRSKVFQDFGFDESLFIDDFAQEKLVRSYVSDEEFYDTIISQFEKKDTDEPLFVFGISMQNHGGYVYEDFESDVKTTNLSREYEDVNQYLSLIHTTDESLSVLIDYFRDYQDDVVIVFFGDHQPNLNSGFYEEMDGGNSEYSKYLIPFFIWKNFSTEEDNAKDIGITSINYLSTIMMQEAGLPMPAYYQFLNEAYQEIPAVHAYGYIENNSYNSLEKDSLMEKEIMSKYWLFQYANVFGNFEGSKLFN